MSKLLHRDNKIKKSAATRKNGKDWVTALEKNKNFLYNIYIINKKKEGTIQ